MTSQLQGVKILKNRLKVARIGIFHPKCQSLTTAISPKVPYKQNQVQIWS